MKKIILILLVLVSFMGISQEREPMRKQALDMTPEQMATLKTKKMTLALDLTDKQHNEVYAVNLEYAKIRKAKMVERKAIRESGEKEELTAELLYARKNEKLDNMIAHKRKMKNILSEEQYEKWEKMYRRKGMHHKKREGNKKRRMHHKEKHLGE